MKPSDNDTNSIRLQVYLSHSGVCSRRAAMDIVKKGEVRVNGEVVKEPSFQVVSGKDKIQYKGKEIKLQSDEYIAFYKPADCVTTKNPQFKQKTIYHVLSSQYSSLVPIGRLDKNTEGLLLLTNDGDLTFKMTHPKFHVDKAYLVKVKGRLPLVAKTKIEKGILLDGRKTAPAKIKGLRFVDGLSEFTIIIHEGRKRQIRVLFEKVGHKVLFIKRLSQGPIELGNLKMGKTRNLTELEIKQLKKI